ncbi:MAG: DUF2631 domain-containing protein [Pseudonocardiales bacterium]
MKAPFAPQPGLELDVPFLDPHGEQPELGAPEDYEEHHPDDHPSDWGWHGEWGKVGRIGAWVAIVILLLMITATHYNASGTVWLILIAGGLIGYQIWDIRRRRNAWRQ